MKLNRTKKLAITALCMAVGMLLPLLISQVKELGDSLLPMHLPVMLCGLVCGYKYGALVGFCLPYLRGFIFGMPLLYPNAVLMSFELATYGLIIGLLYFKGSKNIWALYFALITAMVCGRIVLGFAEMVILGISNTPFSFSVFISGSIIDAIPGIIIQLILIPIIVKIVERMCR